MSLGMTVSQGCVPRAPVDRELGEPVEHGRAPQRTSPQTLRSPRRRRPKTKKATAAALSTNRQV